MTSSQGHPYETSFFSPLLFSYQKYKCTLYIHIHTVNEPISIEMRTKNKQEFFEHVDLANMEWNNEEKNETINKTQSDAHHLSMIQT